MPFPTVVLAALLAAQAPAPGAASPAKVVPMTVQVQAPATADAGAQAWVRELRTALGARKEEFRLVKPGETGELLVRVDSVTRGQGDSRVLNAELVVGKTARPFNLTYPGEIAPQAEKLAAKLRSFADQLKAAGR
ncbi:MAG TPA: hypothetical protein VGB87_17930 [Vicinamibacteria bacterium]